MNEEQPPEQGDPQRAIVIAAQRAGLARAVGVDAVAHALASKGVRAQSFDVGARLPTSERLDSKGRLRCRVITNENGPLRKVTQRVDGKQAYIPARQLHIKGKPMSRAERRVIELQIKREQKRARKGLPR